MARKIFTIPAGQAFLTSLVGGIVDRWHREDDPFALSRVLLLLPTRRSVRAAREAFRLWAEANTAGPILLPSIRPIGDVDEEDLLIAPEASSTLDATLPPAIPDLRRALILARMIAQWHGARAQEGDRGIAPGQALRLAKDLAAFLDHVQTEEVDLGNLAGLAPDRFADHWQHTVTFLSILKDAWPAILQEQKLMDPQARRTALINALTDDWRKTPPSTPVIAAGSTGSVPATARLLKTVSDLPEGAVILPGLDTDIEPGVWERLEDSHPQFGLKQLLLALDCGPDAIPSWTDGRSPSGRGPRIRLLNEALRPAGTTDGWMAITQDIASDEALDGVTRIDAPTPAEEARVIALIMREGLENSRQTTALVTPDRGLARRVRGELQRWGIDVDDSAGLALNETPPAIFLRLVAATVRSRFAPAALLSLLKHPLSRAGYRGSVFIDLVGKLDRTVLRGIRPTPGLAGLVQAVDDKARDRDKNPLPFAGKLLAFVERLREAFQPLCALDDGNAHPIGAWAKAHVAVAEALAKAEGETSGADYLWLGDAGDGLAGLMADLIGDGEHGNPVTLTDYPALFDSLLEGQVVRPPHGKHPRLFIWGPLEARLQQTDVMILGGLNEGTWPSDPGADPWLSRPMRSELGLPSPEYRIGQSAHDFAQLAASPRVFLTRAEKVDGTPQVASRWLLRLENLLKGAARAEALKPQADYLAWAGQLDRPERVARIEEPLPRPPVAARPNRLSVTEIETLIRDPYAIYARHVLKLRPLDPVDQPPGPRERGTAIHDALEHFIARHKDVLPANALDLLREEGRAALEPYLTNPALRLFWWARFENAARWFLEAEEAWREQARPFALEAKGHFALPGPIEFALTGRADRIDRMTDDAYALIDYKTGQPPSQNQVAIGLSPQLPLEAVMIEAGAFEDVPPGPVTHLRYIQVRGGTTPDKISDVTKNPDATKDLVAQTAAGLNQLIGQYMDARTPYRSRTIIQYEKYGGDYDHLARVKEWSVEEPENP